MQRSRRVWLAGPLMMIVFTAVISLAARLTGTSSPIMVFLSPSIAFAVAWILWWPILKPKTGFWLHSAIGIVFSALVLAIEVKFSGR